MPQTSASRIDRATRNAARQSRIETLEWLAATTRESLEAAAADKRAPLINQARLIAAEIESLGGAEPEVSNSVVDFQSELNRRRLSIAADSRDAGERTD